MKSFFGDVFALLGSGWVRPVILALVLGGLWTGLRRAGLDGRERVFTWLCVAAPLLTWLFVVLQLAQAGTFRPGAVPVPAIPLAVILPLLVALPLLLRSPNIAAALDAVPASWLIGLQVYRVLGGGAAAGRVRASRGNRRRHRRAARAAGRLLRSFPRPRRPRRRNRLEHPGDSRSRARPDHGRAHLTGPDPVVRARPAECGHRDLSAGHDPRVRGAAVPDPARTVAVAAGPCRAEHRKLQRGVGNLP